MKNINSLIKRTVCLSLFILSIVGTVFSQGVIDQVIAVVGGDMILSSDVEQEVMRMKMEGKLPEGDAKCDILEGLLIQKLLLHQSKIDSLAPNEAAIEGEIDRRLKYFVNQIGSEKALENYFKKTIFEIKDDLREVIREQQLTQQMRQKIVEKIIVSPSEIKKFYKTIPTDSLPIIPEQFKLQEISLYPPSSAEAKFRVKEKLLDLRSRILKGERFTMLAIAYSEDLASAKKGGELGFRSRDELVKNFADVAFNLAEGQVSQIVETEYGFHIIQMIEKRNNQVNVRHILLKPSFTSDMLVEAQNKLDSIAKLVKLDSLTFEKACLKFSEDKKSKLNGGYIVNPNTNTQYFEKEQLQPSDYYVIKELKKGETSTPFESRDENANVIFKIIKLKEIIPSHKANLNDDYDVIQRLTKQSVEHDKFMNWVKEKQKTTYIKIDPSYKGCKFKSDGWVK
jgi:peptidyl-prolyl cis-trans isomerase SurA